MKGASLSKWPAAIMLAGLVEDNIMKFDDPVNKYLKYWATDEKDVRSKITLRDLMTFTSGYTKDAMVLCTKSFPECAQKLYEKSSHYVAPKTTWTYLSCHLQFAGAMAVEASGHDIQYLFDKYLYKAYNMTSTTWTPLNNP
jgi:CubicO group peptidase (beta-lactamase class C family)